MLNFNLPSAVRYAKTGLMSKYSLGKTLSWYLGQLKLTDELELLFNTNNHTLLLDDDIDLKNKLISYLSIDMIPDEYKKGLIYYNDYDQKFAYPTSKIDGRFKKDKLLVNLIKKTFTAEISPGLAEPAQLIGLPKAYFIVVEWDMLKDESLIYSERLRRAGINIFNLFYFVKFEKYLFI
jgi:acetyl esterase/lipase